MCLSLHTDRVLATLRHMPSANRQRSRRQYCAASLACVLAVVLAACHHAAPPPSNVTPEKAIATNLRLTATGDFDGLMKNRLPAAEYAQWRAEWHKVHAHPVPVSVVQQKQFATIMHMLTEPGAEKKLAKRLAPQLAGLHGGNNQEMPILGGILEAAGKRMIADSPQLGPAQRTLAEQGLQALLAWARTTDFSDPKKARIAIDLVCDTARQLHVQTLKQWRALDYATTMKNYGIIWNGLESVLQIYGLDIGQSLLDAKVSNVTKHGDEATVRLDMSFAGKPLTGQWAMREVAGHWYDVALLDAWHKAHPAPASGASSSPVAPASAATTATPVHASAPPASTTSAPAAPASVHASAPPASPTSTPAKPASATSTPRQN